MNYSKRVRFAVVGVGSIGALHATNLATAIPNAELEALVDSDEARLSALASKLNVAKKYTDYDSVLKDDAVEALVLSVPSFLKREMIEKAAAANKHIFVEKPMVLDLSQAEVVENAVRKSGIKFQVGYQRRFDRAFILAFNAMKTGSLGNLQMVLSRTRDPPGNPQGWLTDPRLSGGIWLDTLTHDFDSIRFLTGAEVTKVYAEAATLVYQQLREKGDYDNVVVTMRLSNGAVGIVDSCAYTPYGYDIRVELIGTKAAAVIEMGDNSSFSLLGSDHEVRDIPKTYHERFSRAYRDELEDFARCILEGDTPKVGVEEGKLAIRIGLAAWEAFKQGRAVSLQ